MPPKVGDNYLVEMDGIHYVEMVCRQMGWVYRRISYPDTGLDGEIEIVENGKATGKCIRVQVKSGKSHFRSITSETFMFYSDHDHVEYWKNHMFPVILVVFNPEEHLGFWVDVQEYAFLHPEISEKPTFEMSKRQVFDMSAKHSLLKTSDTSDFSNSFRKMLFQWRDNYASANQQVLDFIWYKRTLIPFDKEKMYFILWSEFYFKDAHRNWYSFFPKEDLINLLPTAVLEAHRLQLDSEKRVGRNDLDPIEILSYFIKNTLMVSTRQKELVIQQLLHSYDDNAFREVALRSYTLRAVHYVYYNILEECTQTVYCQRIMGYSGDSVIMIEDAGEACEVSKMIHQQADYCLIERTRNQHKDIIDNYESAPLGEIEKSIEGMISVLLDIFNSWRIKQSRSYRTN